MEEKIIEELKKLSKKASAIGELPIAAIVAFDKKIIGKGYNKREKTNKISDHAEIIAIENASKKIGSWKLEKAEIFTTLEPCKMCLNAIFQARISKVFYFAKSNKKVNYKTTKTYQKNTYFSSLLSKFFTSKR